MMKSTVSDGSARIQLQGGASATYLPADVVGTDWIKVQHDFTAANENNSIFFDLGAVPADYYIDDVTVYDLTAITTGAGGDVIPMPDDQKEAVLTDALVKYITDVATHYKGKIAAWDVVNESLNDNGTLRVGSEDLAATNIFYWPYYLGKDYAVTAFKIAHTADPDAKLFINDYNLESASSAKLDGLIEYVNYIDGKGGQVDGIGTQLHLNINWSDTTAIANMFTKLAATGKLIKISELDIAVSGESNPASPVAPTLEQQEKQAKLYEFVARMYTKLIPAAQRYGITVWSISDNAGEHQYWLTNDVPCLWDADYVRKWSYKGFCDGLYGSDVSAGWTYDDLINTTKK
jgi:GH35 family endo-1,4-beta-xylanase